MINCSCENVLCAIGALINVNFVCFVGRIDIVGRIVPVLSREDPPVIYDTQVSNKYDCLSSSLLEFEFDVLANNRRLFCTALGEISDTRDKLYVIFVELTVSGDFFTRYRRGSEWCILIKVKLAGIEPTLLEWKSNVLTVRR